ncbi:hypothetical protein CGC21_25005 [Leishmania donovani]|uniref:Uncharacterized protein n=1 Tax=Leishmania donovani TaxID=5661 RepID=A0A504XUB7_LEIDO|nr:hypothetical protein CGC21_25005 [Leishmania donovani]
MQSRQYCRKPQPPPQPPRCSSAGAGLPKSAAYAAFTSSSLPSAALTPQHLHPSARMQPLGIPRQGGAPAASALTPPPAVAPSLSLPPDTTVLSVHSAASGNISRIGVRDVAELVRHLAESRYMTRQLQQRVHQMESFSSMKTAATGDSVVSGVPTQQGTTAASQAAGERLATSGEADAAAAVEQATPLHHPNQRMATSERRQRTANARGGEWTRTAARASAKAANRTRRVFAAFPRSRALCVSFSVIAVCVERGLLDHTPETPAAPSITKTVWPEMQRRRGSAERRRTQSRSRMRRYHSARSSHDITLPPPPAALPALDQMRGASSKKVKALVWQRRYYDLLDRYTDETTRRDADLADIHEMIEYISWEQDRSRHCHRQRHHAQTVEGDAGGGERQLSRVDATPRGSARGSADAPHAASDEHAVATPQAVAHTTNNGTMRTKADDGGPGGSATVSDAVAPVHDSLECIEALRCEADAWRQRRSPLTLGTGSTSRQVELLMSTHTSTTADEGAALPSYPTTPASMVAQTPQCASPSATPAAAAGDASSPGLQLYHPYAPPRLATSSHVSSVGAANFDSRFPTPPLPSHARQPVQPAGGAPSPPTGFSSPMASPLHTAPAKPPLFVGVPGYQPLSTRHDSRAAWPSQAFPASLPSGKAPPYGTSADYTFPAAASAFHGAPSFDASDASAWRGVTRGGAPQGRGYAASSASPWSIDATLEHQRHSNLPASSPTAVPEALTPYPHASSLLHVPPPSLSMAAELVCAREQLERDIRRHDQLLAAIGKLQKTAAEHATRRGL